MHVNFISYDTSNKKLYSKCVNWNYWIFRSITKIMLDFSDFIIEVFDMAGVEKKI